MIEEIKYNEIEDLDYCLELLEDRDKENYSLSQENSFLKYHIGEKEIEIERLNNIIEEKNSQIRKLEYIKENRDNLLEGKGKEIERLNNIIKEVREYAIDTIDSEYWGDDGYINGKNEEKKIIGKGLLEILDKEKDNE